MGPSWGDGIDRGNDDWAGWLAGGEPSARLHLGKNDYRISAFLTAKQDFNHPVTQKDSWCVWALWRIFVSLGRIFLSGTWDDFLYQHTFCVLGSAT
jgi:hypothetical protein